MMIGSTTRNFLLISLAMLGLAASRLYGDSTVTTERTVAMLADGVYTIRHPDAPDTFPQGNTTVVVGKRAVLVVDSCLLPSCARQDIEQIRRWTSLPVTYLVNTHWHYDHTMGNATYAEAFPAIQIIATRATQKIIGDYNPGVLARYPSRAERFRNALTTGKDLNGEPLGESARKEYERALAGTASVGKELKDTYQLVPNVAFQRELDIDLGERTVRILFLGRANTVGDTIVYLPKDKVVATGDVLDHPVPYMFGGFPVDFVATLRELAALDANIFVPGHGDVLHDKSYVAQVIDFLMAVNAEVEREVNEGKTLDEAQKLVPKALEPQGWKKKFAGDNEDDQSFFDQSFAGLVKASYNQIRMR